MSEATTTEATPLHLRYTPEQLDRLNIAKGRAYRSYLNACEVLSQLDETVPDDIITLATNTRENSWKLYRALVLETEW